MIFWPAKDLLWAKINYNCIQGVGALYEHILVKNHQCTTIIKAKSNLFSFFGDDKSILWSKHSKNPFLVVLDPSK